MKLTTSGFLRNRSRSVGSLLFGFTASTTLEFARPLEAIDTDALLQCRKITGKRRAGGEIVVGILLSYSILSDYDFGAICAPFSVFSRLIICSWPPLGD